jgi:hypothetical protein
MEEQPQSITANDQEMEEVATYNSKRPGNGKSGNLCILRRRLVSSELSGEYFKFKMAFIPCIDTRPSEGMFFKRYVNYRNLSALFSEGFLRCIFMRIRF